MENTAKILNQKNLKATPQRIAIYEYLLGTGDHPTAETIYAALKPAHPNLSLATVYKNVASLKDAGLLMEFSLGGEGCRYDARTYEHAHVVCRKCHKVFDIDLPADTAEHKKTVSLMTNMDIDTCMMYYYGVCEDCWSK